MNTELLDELIDRLHEAEILLQYAIETASSLKHETEENYEYED